MLTILLVVECASQIVDRTLAGKIGVERREGAAIDETAIEPGDRRHEILDDLARAVLEIARRIVVVEWPARARTRRACIAEDILHFTHEERCAESRLRMYLLASASILLYDQHQRAGLLVLVPVDPLALFLEGADELDIRGWKAEPSLAVPGLRRAIPCGIGSVSYRAFDIEHIGGLEVRDELGIRESHAGLERAVYDPAEILERHVATTCMIDIKSDSKHAFIRCFCWARVPDRSRISLVEIVISVAENHREVRHFPVSRYERRVVLISAPADHPICDIDHGLCRVVILDDLGLEPEIRAPSSKLSLRICG